jgi:hypothetical protein
MNAIKSWLRSASANDTMPKSKRRGSVINLLANPVAVLLLPRSNSIRHLHSFIIVFLDLLVGPKKTELRLKPGIFFFCIIHIEIIFLIFAIWHSICLFSWFSVYSSDKYHLKPSISYSAIPYHKLLGFQKKLSLTRLHPLFTHFIFQILDFDFHVHIFRQNGLSPWFLFGCQPSQISKIH